MALPRAISGTVRLNGFYGPVRDDSGNHYMILRDSTNSYQAEAWKADNGDAVWSEQDGTNRIDLGSGNTINDISIRLHDHIIYIVTLDRGSEAIHFSRYAVSSHATNADEWLETATSLGNYSAPWVGYNVDIEVVSASNITVLMGGALERVHGTDYNRAVYRKWNGSSWGSETQIDAGGQVDYYAQASAKGASNKVHFTYKDQTNNDLDHRSVTDAGTLGTIHTLRASVGGTRILNSGVYYDDAGVERITFCGSSATDVFAWVIDDDGTPTQQTVTTDNHNGLPSISVDTDNDTTYVIWSENTDDDIHYSSSVDAGSWASSTEIVTGLTQSPLSSNIYTIDNGDKVIGFSYGDSGNQYNEYVIEAASTDLSVSASDLASLSESVDLDVGINVVISDSINLSESIIAILESFVLTSDGVSLSESVSLLLENNVNVSDASSLSENIQIALGNLQAIVSDNISTAESINLLLESYILVSDSVAVAENISIIVQSVVFSISVLDTITTSESVNVLLEILPFVSDNPSVAESVSLVLESYIATSDSISVAEAILVILESLIAVNDSVSLSENTDVALGIAALISDNVSLVESITLLLESLVSVSDNVSISESVNLIITSISDLIINASDLVAVSEAVSLALSDLQVSANDAVAISESVVMLLESIINVSDSVTVSESTKFLLQSFVNRSDTVATSESIIVRLGDLQIDVSDSPSIAEFVAIAIEAGAGELLITVSDAIGLSESTVITIGNLQANASDIVSISESVAIGLTSYINVSDTISVLDQPLIDLGIGVSVSENVTISESVLVALADALSISTSDSIGLVESVIATIGGGVITDVALADVALFLVELTDGVLYSVKLTDKSVYSVDLSDNSRS